MKQVMYGIEVVDVNDSKDWVRYEPVREDVARTPNHHMYLSFQNEYHTNQFAEGRKSIINVKDGPLEGVIGNARILKAVVEHSTLLGMNGYGISAPAYARSTVKSLGRATGSIPENTIYTFSDTHYKDMETDFNSIPDLMTHASIEVVDILPGSISFVSKNLLYHYPHYFIIGDSQIKIPGDDHQIGG